MKDGKHIARATGTYDFAISSKQSEYVRVGFVIAEGPATGERINADLYFTPKTEQRSLEALRYCGWDGDDPTELSNITANCVELDIKGEEYEGKTNPRVQWINQIRGVTVKNQMDSQAKKAFAARMRGTVMAVDKSLAAPNGYVPTPSKAASGEYDGDPGPQDSDYSPDSVGF